jgi:polysaccharide pyruvyl transferase WcaK-like protein
VVNQTVDLGGKEKLESVVAKVYNMLDFISVREPLSYAYVKKIGITHAVLVPDCSIWLAKNGKRGDHPKNSIIPSAGEVYDTDRLFRPEEGPQITRIDEKDRCIS